MLLRTGDYNVESEARSYLAELDRLSSQKCYESTVAEWAYATDINSENEEAKLQASLEFAKLTKEIWKNVTSAFGSWKTFRDVDLFRKIKKTTVLGAEALPDDEYRKVIVISFGLTFDLSKLFSNIHLFLYKYKELETEMTKHYSTTKVCSYQYAKSCHLSLEPGKRKYFSI